MDVHGLLASSPLSPSRRGRVDVENDDVGDERMHNPPGGDDGDAGQHHHSVRRACYPIPAPLAAILSRAVVRSEVDDDEGGSVVMEDVGDGGGAGGGGVAAAKEREEVRVRVERESLERALGILCGNAFQALDAMFFQTPAKVRRRPAFRHRLCLRVHLDPEASTLSITDLGCGMTRSDLINVLGVGSRLSPDAASAAASLAQPSPPPPPQQQQQQQPPTGRGGVGGADSDMDAAANAAATDGNMSEGTEDIYSDIEEDEVCATGGARGGVPGVVTLPCTSDHVGGFYAALCSLGTYANVGTKSKFDDYYEFEVGLRPPRRRGDGSRTVTAPSVDGGGDDAPPPPSSPDLSHFTITRPMDEGTTPTADNGYGRFADVRGECGTRITLALNRRAVAAGLLTEDVLKPMLLRIFETSQYTVAFSTDEEAGSIIEASRREEEDDEARGGSDLSDGDLDESDPQQVPKGLGGPSGSHNTVKERSKYIPIRLSLGERKMLRLVEAAMACTDYTSDVDARRFRSSARRTHAQLRGVSAVLRGLVIACDYSAGQKLLQEGNYTDYEEFFRQMFEIARRHKIMNPEKMRTEYGKLVYLLQDAVSPTVQSNLGFSCKGRIETVYKFLEERDALALVEDPLIEVATQEILAEKKSRSKINAEIKRKEKAVAALKAKYRSSRLSSEDIHLCLYSICDNNSFLNSNRVPIDKVIGYLKGMFSPDKIKEGYCLSIVSGQDGARLSHSHERQYYFALQSLTLWRDIVDDMFRLWAMAEEDLLSESVTYALKDTGQGMQRVQQSPRTYRAMQQILSRVQGKVNKWVGSSVIHLGDHNVPNALSFIDKYTQVPRILGPIVICLENLERICDEDDGISSYVQSAFGGLDKLKKDIMFDFFRSAFDGSGADNFYDAGSCIDGRLTSAWNWCSQLSTKPYYPMFKLTGFIGFDGEFK